VQRAYCMYCGGGMSGGRAPATAAGLHPCQLLPSFAFVANDTRAQSPELTSSRDANPGVRPLRGACVAAAAAGAGAGVRVRRWRDSCP